MNHILYKIFFCIFSFIYGGVFNACASYTLEVANVSLYNEGVQIVDSFKPKSKVRLEVGQHLVGGVNAVPLALFISALNLSLQNVIFAKEDISLYQNGKPITALNDKELKTQNFDFSSIVESYHLFIPSSPMPSRGIPFIYRGYMGGFYIYDEMQFLARERMITSIELDWQRNNRAVILSSILQKNTLEPKGSPRGGFVIYAPSALQVGKLELEVRVGEERHTFALELKK